MRCVVPVSGGLDSAVVLHYAKTRHTPGVINEIFPISFYYGQKHDRELKFADFHARNVGDGPHEYFDMLFCETALNSALTRPDIFVAKTRDVLGDPQTVNYVPFRNMMMLSIACAYAETVGAEAVFHGAAQVDSQAGYWDGSVEFLEQINKLIDLNRRHRIKIEAPLIDKSKKEIVEMAVEYGVPVRHTHTCYEGRAKACGECPACSSRLKGFIDAGYIDPIEYDKDIDCESHNCKPIG